ncbi:MAG: glycosyl hydrolase, partial [Saprospiraceae bacterium]|nr:glycosyl hydrolase [Saprospiraceae bacterium]
GKDFIEISGDLTKGGREGDVPFGTITTFDESKMKFGLIYTGSDDGLVHVTKDGGHSWTVLSDSLPRDFWVSRIQASAFDEGTVYLTLNGYRNDHFKPYVYKSTDFGQDWINISANLPDEPVNVIKEDPLDRDILYVGTDHGTYVSLNKGTNYMSLAAEMPKVPVHDLVVQKKSKHLIIGTHGRSLYKVDIRNLYEMKKNIHEPLIVFKPDDIRYDSDWGKKSNAYTELTIPVLNFEAFSDTDKEVKLEIMSPEGIVLKSVILKLKKGLSRYETFIRVDKSKEPAFLKSIEKSDWVKSQGIISKAEDGYYYLIPGKYVVKLSFEKTSSKFEFTVK